MLQQVQCYVTAAALLLIAALPLLFAMPWLYGKLRRCGIFFVFVAAGFLYSMATKPTPSSRVFYDGGIKAGTTPNSISNDVLSISWQRDTSGGVYVPESAVVYIDAVEHGGSNVVNIAQTVVGAWGWTGTVQNATNMDFYVWAYYIPPEPVHTNGVWVYKTMRDRRGENAIPLRARVEVNGKAIATPKEVRKDEEDD